MKYMHHVTGSIDTRKGWIESIEQQEIEDSGFDTAESVFDYYVDEGVLVPVVSKREAARLVYKINVAPKQWVVVNQGHHSAPMDYWQAIDRVRETRDELTGN